MAFSLTTGVSVCIHGKSMCLTYFGEDTCIMQELHIILEPAFVYVTKVKVAIYLLIAESLGFGSIPLMNAICLYQKTSSWMQSGS